MKLIILVTMEPTYSEHEVFQVQNQKHLSEQCSVSVASDLSNQQGHNATFYQNF